MRVRATSGDVQKSVEFAVPWLSGQVSPTDFDPLQAERPLFGWGSNRLRSAAGYVLELDAPEKPRRCQRRGVNTGTLAGIRAQPICGPKKRLLAGYKRRRLAPKKQKRTRSLLRKVKALLSPKKQKA